MPYDRNSPHNNLPLLPPDLTKVETVAVLKKTASARAALAELKGRLASIPNPKMLINAIVLQEAKDSSEIENIFTTTDELYKAFSSKEVSNPNAKEVLNYRQALVAGVDKLKIDNTLDIESAINIYQIIKDTTHGIRHPSAKTRIRRAGDGNVIYTPPEGEVIIKNLLDNLFEFARTNKHLDPLVKMALTHYQFEAIHPFSDGNGRTGRVLNALFLVQEGLLDLPVLYLSRYIIDHKNDYYEFLKGITEIGKWEQWILYILDAVEQTATYTLNNVNGILEIFQATVERIKNETSFYKYELVLLLFSQPYCRISFLQDAGIASSRNTASKYLNTLADIGILDRKQEGSEQIFVNTALFNLLSR